MSTQEWILIAVVAIIFITALVLRFQKTSRQELVTRVKHEAFQLFLFAEKQNWVGPDKMAWCVTRLKALLPPQIAAIFITLVPEDTLEKWLQGVYDEFKAKLEETLA